MRIAPALLALSLAANVFLGGFVAGRLVGPQGFHHRGHRGAEATFEARALSPEGREIVRAAFKEQREALFGSARESRKRRDAVAAALAADPFDRAGVEAAVAAFRETDAEHRRAIAKTLIDAAEKLSVEDRKSLAASQFGAAHGRRGRMMRLLHEDGPPPGETPPPPPE